MFVCLCNTFNSKLSNELAMKFGGSFIWHDIQLFYIHTYTHDKKQYKKLKLRRRSMVNDEAS